MDITQQVKNAQLDLMIELDRICKKYEIPYFMIGGTLIGAIRHDGFIPWDDDIDVGMLWEHYDKLRQACEKELDPAYELHDWHTDPHSPHPFYKLKIKGTHYHEEISGDSKMDDGIFIDIFPFDNAPDSNFARKVQSVERNVLRKIILVRCGFALGKGSAIKEAIYKLLRFLSCIRSVPAWKRSYEKMRTRYNRTQTRCVANICGAYAYEKECQPREVMTDVTDHVFEGRSFRVPVHYHTYLHDCYGDYMQLPPEEKRVGIHNITNIDLGDYAIRCR